MLTFCMPVLGAAMLWASSSQPPLAVTHLGQPCGARQVLAGRVVVDRESGREVLVLTNMNETSGMELLFVDFENDTARVFRAPAGAGSWALNEVSGDRLVVGTYYDGVFMVFDLRAMSFVKVAAFPGESYIWNLARGKDGRIYGGTYAGGKLGALDLDTYAVEDCGAPVPPNLYLRQVSALPDGRILCSFGMEQPATRIYDPATKTFSTVPETVEGVSVGVTWHGCFLAGGSVFQGSNLERVTPPPFPVPEGGNWSVNTYVTTEHTLVLAQGNAVYEYLDGQEGLTRVCDMPLRGGNLYAIAKDGRILGVRGQDYFVLKPGDEQLHLKRIPGEPGARPTLFLKVDAEGRLWGGPHFGQTLFHMNPKTGETVNTGAVCDGGGEVYDVAFLDGKVYAAAYAGGDIVEYDPAQPWDQWDLKNPRPVTQLNKHGYIRPTGGILVGPGKKLYSGWMAQYGVYGGAVAITDPVTGETDVIENPLGEQAVAGLAVDDGVAYVGTCLSANGLPKKPNDAPGFGVIDLATKKVAYKQTFDSADAVDRLAYDATHRAVFMTVDGNVRVYSLEKKEVLPPPTALPPAVTSRSVVCRKDGTLVYGHEKQLIQLGFPNGLAAPEAAVLAELPAHIDTMALGGQGEMYVSCGADVYRIGD